MVTMLTQSLINRKIIYRCTDIPLLIKFHIELSLIISSLFNFVKFEYGYQKYVQKYGTLIS